MEKTCPNLFKLMPFSRVKTLLVTESFLLKDVSWSNKFWFIDLFVRKKILTLHTSYGFD